MYFPSRRQLLRSGLAITLTQAKGKPRNARLRIVVTGGHPGDPEYGCGGTVARYTDLGHEVTLLYLNRGEKTCPESQPNRGSAVRVPEAQRAAEILKARAVFAGQCDGHAIVDPAHYDEFRALVASQKPDVLFTHWPVDNHADHRAISALAYDAWLKSGKTFAFYFYEVSDGEDTQLFSPTDYVDISGTETRKRAACYAHASQNPDRYYALQSDVARFRGIESGYRQAEAFVRHARSVRVMLP
ncbi:MAG: PIG-L family deacetylase [Acidobacteriota bacterium]|nr:PIG-L family deacetylase [Acidobacteriota bacterium]